jgi:uncharacterized protein (DUF1697 family)
VTEYVALLRGINVGGRNLISMTALKGCFEERGFRNVATYIQSGNVLFAARASPAKLVPEVEAMLSAAFGYPASVVLRTHEEMRRTVGEAPKGFGAQSAKYRYDVLYLRPSLSAAVALESVPTREDVDRVHAGKGVLYFSRLIARASQSHLSRIVSMPMYREMTIRNWNTTVKLLAMMDARAG